MKTRAQTTSRKSHLLPTSNFRQLCQSQQTPQSLLLSHGSHFPSPHGLSASLLCVPGQEGAFLQHRAVTGSPALLCATQHLKRNAKIRKNSWHYVWEYVREEYLQFQCLHAFFHCRVWTLGLDRCQAGVLLSVSRLNWTSHTLWSHARQWAVPICQQTHPYVLFKCL